MLPITPPTDNLYKFIALFGLLIFAMGIIQLVSERSEFVAEKTEISKIENKVLDSIYIHAVVPDSFATFKHDHSSMKTIDDWIDDVKKVRKLTIDSPVIPDMLTREIITELDNAIERLRSIRHIKRLLYVTIFLGSVMMLFGFWMWYMRDQKWLDQKIKHDSEK